MSKTIIVMGGIATGKSTACKFLKAAGAQIISVDEIAKELRHHDRDIKIHIARIFGPTVRVNPTELEIDDSVLRILAFSNPEKLKELEEIMVPRILEKIDELLFIYEGEPLVAIEVHDCKKSDAFSSLASEVWVTTCSREVQIARIMERNGWDEDYALLRIEAQRPQSELVAEADIVIDSTEEGNLEKTVKELALTYLQKTIE